MLKNWRSVSETMVPYWNGSWSGWCHWIANLGTGVAAAVGMGVGVGRPALRRSLTPSVGVGAVMDGVGAIVVSGVQASLLVEAIVEGGVGV